MILPFGLSADVVTEGEVDIRFRITNLDDYPEYEFYVMYQTYHYDEGYQPGDVIETLIEANKVHQAGERGSKSALYARKKGDKNGPVFESNVLLGGDKIISDYKARAIIEEIEITSVEDGKVEFKVEDRFLMYDNGKEKRFKNAGAILGVELFGVDLGYIVLPLVCLIGLVVFFMLRKKKSATA